MQNSLKFSQGLDGHLSQGKGDASKKRKPAEMGNTQDDLEIDTFLDDESLINDEMNKELVQHFSVTEENPIVQTQNEARN